MRRSLLSHWPNCLPFFSIKGPQSKEWKWRRKCYLYSRLRQSNSHGKFFPHEDVRVMSLRKGSLQFLKLSRSKTSPVSLLFTWFFVTVDAADTAITVVTGVVTVVTDVGCIGRDWDDCIRGRNVHVGGDRVTWSINRRVVTEVVVGGVTASCLTWSTWVTTDTTVVSHPKMSMKRGMMKRMSICSMNRRNVMTMREMRIMMRMMMKSTWI